MAFPDLAQAIEDRLSHGVCPWRQVPQKAKGLDMHPNAIPVPTPGGSEPIQQVTKAVGRIFQGVQTTQAGQADQVHSHPVMLCDEVTIKSVTVAGEQGIHLRQTGIKLCAASFLQTLKIGGGLLNRLGNGGSPRFSQHGGQGVLRTMDAYRAHRVTFREENRLST